MKNDVELDRKWSGVLVNFFVILVILCGVIQYSFLDFNNRIMHASIGDKESKARMEMGESVGKGEQWKSSFRISDNPGSVKVFTGETVKGMIINDNRFGIRNWSMKVVSKNECYLNGFWGGSVEVHQFRNGKEIVETVYSKDDNHQIEKLDVNSYVDVMMIHLVEGDYFVFLPAKELDADDLKADNQISVVFNMYYIEPLDFTGSELIFQNDIKLRDTWMYPVIIVLWVIWLCVLFSNISAYFTKKRMVRDLQNSAQAISVMADLYFETYMINPNNQSIQKIKGDTEKALVNCETGSIQECLFQYAEMDCRETHVEALKKFIDPSTYEERIEENASIVFEYKSKAIGWCSVRIFKLKRKNDNLRYILAIQDINEERKKLYAVEEQVRQNENTKMIQGNFMENTFFAVNALISTISATSEQLAEKLVDEEHKMMAKAVNNSIEHVYLLNNCTKDLFAMSADCFEIKNEKYNMRDMIDKLHDILLPYSIGKEFEFLIEVDESIPKQLFGDKERLMQILVVLLFSSMFVTEKGFVKLSVFGKQNGNIEELIFSVKDSAMGFTEEQVMEIQEVFKDSDLKPLNNAALVYLQIMNQTLLKMNSEMKIVSVLGSGSEFYFSIEQEVINE